MRRALLAIVGTIAGLMVLLSFKTPSATPDSPPASSAATAAQASSAGQASPLAHGSPLPHASATAHVSTAHVSTAHVSPATHASPATHGGPPAHGGTTHAPQPGSRHRARTERKHHTPQDHPKPQ